MPRLPDYRHPAFPEPHDPDCTIWRYMGISKFEDIVRTRSLYMSRADRLGEAFEGSTTPAHLAYWHEVARKAETEEARANVLRTIERLSEFTRGMLPSWYVSCWHINPVENYAMWKLYARDEAHNEAIAISSTYKLLGEVLPAFIHIGCVRYIDFNKEKYTDENLAHRIMHKRHFFEYEKELRAVAQRVELPGGFAQPDPAHFSDYGYRPPIDPCKLITSVVVHPDASEEFFRRVAKLCDSHQLPSPTVSGLAGVPVY